MSDKTFLLLGGAGLVGLQVARAIAREMEAEKIVIASLYQREVRQALSVLKKECGEIEWVGVWGDVFVREEFQHERRTDLMASQARRNELFDDLLGDFEGAYRRSRLVQLILEHRPNVIVDSINTATAISYQDVYAASVIAKNKMDTLFGELDGLTRTVHQLTGISADTPTQAIPGRASVHGTTLSPITLAHSREQLEHLLAQLATQVERINEVRKPAQKAFESLVISQAVPQLIRHMVLMLRAMDDAGTRLYLKIGTTGTGGMGLNIPYTHGEDKPSAKLMSKTAVGFAQTGLMFLMARTPDAPIVKEIKPAAMIGYADISMRAIHERGKQVMRYVPKTEKLNDTLILRENTNEYQEQGELKVVIVDTGENGLFAKGEFEASGPPHPATAGQH